jgi:hypothetical protein
MTRNDLINKLVARKMANGPAQAPCVSRCLGLAARKTYSSGSPKPPAAPRR